MTARFSARLEPAPSLPPSPLVVDRMVTHFLAVGTGPNGTERLASSADAVVTILRHALALGSWQRVIELARVASPAFLLSARWGAWHAVLDAALRASRAIGDEDAEAWARHQLDVRAAALAEQTI
ncbi:MAG: hypothetical protein ACLGI2_04415 [Acidimicrobiia bacterium]